MPWVSRDDLDHLRERATKADVYFDEMLRFSVEAAKAQEAHMIRREQVRHLRKTIHRLRSDIGAAVNIAVEEAHSPAPKRKANTPPSEGNG